jgi:hypothetical protein
MPTMVHIPDTTAPASALVVAWLPDRNPVGQTHLFERLDASDNNRIVVAFDRRPRPSAPRTQ